MTEASGVGGASGPNGAPELSADAKADMKEITADGEVTAEELKQFLEEHGEELKSWMQAMANAMSKDKGGPSAAKEGGGGGGGGEAKGAEGGGGGGEAQGAEGGGDLMSMLQDFLKSLGLENSDISALLQNNPQLQEILGGDTGADTQSVPATTPA